MAAKRELDKDSTELKRTKQQWIERAADLKAERFEVAGALFNVSENDLISESEAKEKLKKFTGGEA